jgi:hypothetical protein
VGGARAALRLRPWGPAVPAASRQDRQAASRQVRYPLGRHVNKLQLTGRSAASPLPQVTTPPAHARPAYHRHSLSCVAGPTLLELSGSPVPDNALMRAASSFGNPPFTVLQMLNTSLLP